MTPESEQPQPQQVSEIPVYAHATPGPVSWAIDVLSSEAGPILRIRIEHLGGSTPVFLSPADAQHFARTLDGIALKAQVGIQIVPAQVLDQLPKPPNSNGRPRG